MKEMERLINGEDLKSRFVVGFANVATRIPK